MKRIANLEVFFEKQGLNLRDVLSDYQQKGMSCMQVAEILGVSKNVVYKKAKKYSIAFLPNRYVNNYYALKIKKDESKKRAILDLLADGYNQEEIKEILGFWKTISGLSIFARKNSIKFDGNKARKIPKTPCRKQQQDTLDFWQRLSLADAIKNVREKNRFACMALPTSVYYLI